MWYFFSETAIGRMLIRLRHAIPVDPGEHVRRPPYLAIDDPPRVANARGDAFHQLRGSRVHGDEGLALAHARTHRRLDHEACRRIDPVFLARAAGPKLERRETHLQRIDALDITVDIRADGDPGRREGQAPLQVTALRRQHALEPLSAGARAEHLRDIGRDAREVAHLPRHPQADLEQLLVALTGQRIERLLHLERVADRA